MKIKRVTANNRRRLFEIETKDRALPFPYAKAQPEPTTDDPIVELFVDPELAREAFTYVLASGAEGSVHIDWVLDHNEDPAYLADLLVHRLTVEAVKRFETSPLSAREIARLLHTSPTQLYRLIDTTNYTKSAKQLFTLLHALGCEVEFTIKDHALKPAAR